MFRLAELSTSGSDFFLVSLLLCPGSSRPQFSVGSLFLCVLLSPDIAIRGKHLPGVGVNGQCLEVMLADVLEHS